MANPIAIGLGGLANTGAAGLSVATVGTLEMSLQYSRHRDEILDNYAQGLTRRSELYGDGTVFKAEDLNQHQKDMALDSFRHAYSSGYLKMHFGKTIASSFDLWEIAGPAVHAPKNAAIVAMNGGNFDDFTEALLNATPSGSKMDYWNNAIMRHEDVSQDTIVPIILEKMRTNELALDQSDTRLKLYDGPGLPSAALAKNMLYEPEQTPADYFGFVNKDDVPAIGDTNEDIAVSIQWSYEQLLEKDNTLVLTGYERSDVETLYAAAEGDTALQAYLQHVDYQLASNEAVVGVQGIKPVIGNISDIPSTLQEDDVLLNPSGAPELRATGFSMGK